MVHAVVQSHQGQGVLHPLAALAPGHVRREDGEGEAPPSRHQVAEALVPYLEHWHRRGTPVGHVTRHLLLLFAGQPGARAWRRHLTEGAPGGGPEILREALKKVPPQTSISTSPSTIRTG